MNQGNFNIALGWTDEINRLIHLINELQALCREGNSGFLEKLHSQLGVLFDHMYSDIYDQKNIQDKLNSAQKSIDNLSIMNTSGVSSMLVRKLRERKVLNELIEARRLIDKQMKSNGIKHKLKMRPKEMALYQWNK